MPDPYRPPVHGWRTFLIVWATQSVSVFGSALTFFAISVWLAQSLYPNPDQKAQLAAALSAVSLAFAVPVVFGAPLAGAWADRHDRRRTMLAMDLASSLLSLVLAGLVIAHALSLPLLLGLLAISSILTSFHGSAFDTSYAMLVPEERLPRANGMMQTMWSLSGLLAPALAATLIALPALARQSGAVWAPLAALGRLSDGTALVMGVDGITFFAAAVTLLFLDIPSPVRHDLATTDAHGRVQRKSVWADVREGGMYIWRRRPLFWLLLTFTAINFTAAPVTVLMPLLLKYNLAADWGARGMTYEAALALLSTISAAGGLLGGLLISTWGGLRKRRVYGVLVPILCSGAVQAFYGLASLLYLSGAALFILAGLIPIMNAHSQTIWQTQTPHALQGRVFAVRRLIAQCTYPLGTALAGLGGGLLNAGILLAVLGVLLVVFCVAQFFNASLLSVEDKALLDQMAAQGVGE